MPLSVVSLLFVLYFFLFQQKSLSNSKTELKYMQKYIFRFMLNALYISTISI